MKDPKIDDIVSMIDRFMSNNGGHMNIQVDNDGEIQTEETFSKTIIQTNSSDCASGDTACKIPNLFEGLDTEE